MTGPESRENIAELGDTSLGFLPVCSAGPRAIDRSIVPIDKIRTRFFFYAAIFRPSWDYGCHPPECSLSLRLPYFSLAIQLR
ncbi:hypothetical protein DAPPUDRAFT_246930 [Daphnia pulex]|uniref:Uncharacterized protein n=1 Tax=Daphnia pulex TaxID=6669 RepID=E9GRG7_DAPPU|nr:hypothetical protein DAPPUDRAFT_246930 [Daphnia pulex]|eukprot:EFX77918.1 hypothetical protein DAPPUDRAFT_246930 [Daphnia pulex]